MRSTDIERRMVAISGRANREAWVQIQRYLDHPNAVQLMRHLEQLEGVIRETDVAAAIELYIRQRTP